MKKAEAISIQAPNDHMAMLQQSLAQFAASIRDALAIPENEWPEGRELTVTLDFQIIPKISCKITKR